MSDRVYTVLFLCTHNSARSVLAEAAMNSLGRGRFRGYSAGSHPSGRVNPYALELLAHLGHDVSGIRSKSWDEFAAPGPPPLDFVITVCDDAAGETCPHWPGQPATAHWGLPDPSRVEGSESEKRAAFAETFRMLTRRIEPFTQLPMASLDKLARERHMTGIHQAQKTEPSTESQ